MSKFTFFLPMIGVWVLIAAGCGVVKTDDDSLINDQSPTPEPLSCPFNRPSHVAALDDGGLVMVNHAGLSMCIFDAALHTQAVVLLQQAPSAVAVIGDAIVLANPKLGGLDRYSKDGVFLGRMAQDAGWPSAIVVAPDLGRVFIGDGNSYRVLVYDLDGNQISAFGSPGDGPGQFYRPADLAWDAGRGLLFLADYENQRVQVFDGQGNYVRELRTFDTDPQDLIRPVALAVHPNGTLFVLDSLWSGVYVFDSDGSFNRIFGNFGRGPKGMRNPSGMRFIEPDFNVLAIADWQNNRLKLFTTDGGAP